MRNSVRNNHSMLFIFVSLLFLFCSSMASAACIEEWKSGSGSTYKVQQQKCGDHTGGEWWYEDGNGDGLVIKPGEKNDSHLFYIGTTGNIPRYFRKGNDVYWVDVSREDGCHFSTGDASGMGLLLTTPSCWIMSKITNKFSFYKMNLSGRDFYSLSQSQKTENKFNKDLLNAYSADKSNVYKLGWIHFEGADPKTFHVLIPHEDFDGIDIRNMEYDSHHIYQNNKIIAYDNWREMKTIPIDALEPGRKKNSTYFIKASKDKVYVFSDSSYTIWKNINTEGMHCHGEYSNMAEFYCVIDGKKFKASSLYAGGELELNALPE